VLPEKPESDQFLALKVLPNGKNLQKSIINNIISTLLNNLASAPPLPILGRGRGGYNFESNGRGGYNF